MLRRKSSLLILTVVLLFVTQDATAKDKWINLKTNNFNVVSNAGEDETRELALKLEQFRYVFTQLFKVKNTEPIPVTVLVFKNDNSFKPFKPMYNGKPANIAGYFQAGEDENTIALDISANDERPMGTIYHEYVHLLTSSTLRRWPAWLTEGIAEVYSSFEARKKEVTLGVPIANHVHFLRQNSFIPLNTMFGAKHSSEFYNERTKQGVFYAQSWALVHYMMFGDRQARQPQLTQFIRLFDSGQEVQAAFSKAFQTDLAGMEKKLKAYIQNSTYDTVVYTMDKTEGETRIESSLLSDAEVEYRLGNLLLHTDRASEAEPYFKRAIALDSSLVGPYEGLAFIAMRSDRREEAKTHFEEARKRNSKNHLARYFYAESVVMANNGKAIDAETAKQVMAELKMAADLKPSFPRAHELKAYVALSSGEFLDEGIRGIKQARQLEPENQRFPLMQAQLEIRARDYTSAKKTLEAIRSSNAEGYIKSSAESLLKAVDALTGTTETSGALPPPPSDGSAPVLRRRSGSGRTEGGAGPSVRIADTEVLSGTLAVIDCDRAGSMSLIFRNGDQLIHFRVADPATLMFYSSDPDLKVDIKCGAINLPAYIQYKSAPPGTNRFHGDAVAVEFTSQNKQ